MVSQKTLKDFLDEQQRNKNVLPTVDVLDKLPLDVLIEEEQRINALGETYIIYVVEVNGVKYRLPKSVLNQIKEIISFNPHVKAVKVSKTGSGMDTRYFVLGV